MVVGRDSGHADQALEVRRPPAFHQPALVGKEGFALHEEQREGRQADIRHAVGHLAAPLVGKGRAGRANACQKGLKHLHAGLNHTSSQSETHPSHQPFRIAGKSAKRGLSAEQVPILVARDRQGATTDAVLTTLNRVSIAAALDGGVTPANEFCCDGGTAIVAFARRAKIPAHVLPMPGKPNPTAPDFHLNNVNAYHGRLKEWLRRFHGVATKNLPNYLGWRRTLEALGENATSAAMILGAIGLGPYQQATP